MSKATPTDPSVAATAIPPLEFAPALVEETVLRAIDGHPLEAEFREQRDCIYEHPDTEARNNNFERLHANWFRRLRLASPVVQALGEQPLLASEVHACRVIPARSRRDEAAELFVDPDLQRPKRTVVITLQPTTLQDAEQTLFLLRHEIAHVVDMLDPAFGYRPGLPEKGDPTYDSLVRERYRALWCATIDGRLLRRAQAQSDVRQRRLKDFAATFPPLPGGAERAFTRWFDHPSPTHGELVAFAQNPGGHAFRCPLCAAPAMDRQSASQLSPEVVQSVRIENPDWEPERGLCPHCVDLYAGRMMRHTGVRTA